MLNLKVGAVPLLLISMVAMSQAQRTSNLQLLTTIDPAPGFPTSLRYSEVTGCGDLVAICGWSAGGGGRNVYLLDVSNPQEPDSLTVVKTSGSVYDAQIHGKYLYIAVQNLNYIDVFDIIDPRNPELVNHFRPGGIDSISPHTLCVVGDVLYVADYFSSVAIYDISDRRNFVRKFTYQGSFGTSHDHMIMRGKWYGAFIFAPAGLGYFDVTNPFAPIELAKVRYPGAGTHYAWPTEDERYILTTDEIGSTAHDLKIWDTQTPGQLNLVAEYRTRPGSTIHNVYVRGRYAYISYYCDGVRILDILDPTKPVEVAAYNIVGTSPCSGYESVWGIYPFSKHIYVSEMKRGLFVFNFDDHPAANFIGTVKNAQTEAPIAGAYVYFLDEYPTTRSTASGEFEIPWFKDGVEQVVAEAQGYFADTARVNISATGTTEWHFTLVSKTPVHVNENESAPEQFMLLPSYPNPFSLSVQATPLKIVYELPFSSNVELTIMNALGQEVKKLIARNQNSGRHVVHWEGTDEHGRKVSTGVYFVNLRTRNRIQQQKVVVVR